MEIPWKPENTLKTNVFSIEIKKNLKNKGFFMVLYYVPCFFVFFFMVPCFLLVLYYGPCFFMVFYIIYSWIYTTDHPYDPQIHAATIRTATTHKKPPSRYTRHATRQYWKLRKGGGDITGINKCMNISMKYHGIKIFSWLLKKYLFYCVFYYFVTTCRKPLVL